jgi:hypothetical protein
MYEKSHDEYSRTSVRCLILYILCVVLCAVMYSSCDFSYICEMSYLVHNISQMYEKSQDEYMTVHSTTQSMYKIRHLTDVRKITWWVHVISRTSVRCLILYIICVVLCAVMYSSCDFSYICEMSYLVHNLCCTMCCHVLIMWFLVHLWDVVSCTYSMLYYYNTEYVQNRTSHGCTRNHMMSTWQHTVQHRVCTR